MLVEVVVSSPMPRWQHLCLEHLGSVPGLILRTRSLPAERRPFWWDRIAARIDILASADHESGAVMQEGLADITIDLSGKLPPDQAVWRLLQADGRPLSMPYPFADRWNRPDAVASVFLVDTRSRILDAAHMRITGKPYPTLLNALLRTCAYLPARACRAKMSGCDASDGEMAASPARTFAPWAKLSVGWLRYLSGRLYRLPMLELWRIGIASQPIHRFLDGTEPHVDWLTPIGETSYCADPFPHPGHPGEVWYERYDYESGLGVLECVQPEQTSAERPAPIQATTHLSYPFMTRVGDDIILIPEMQASGKTCIYRLNSDQAYECIASLSVPGIDPVLFRWDGRFWLGLTDARIDRYSNYCLWHAETLAGPWTPHHGNPVKLDVRSARGAGTPFWHEGHLYRPAQDCSQTYGGAVTINRVVECSSTRYREETAAVIRPRPEWTASAGLHTLSACGERTLFDAKAYVFNLAGIRMKLAHALGSGPRRPIRRPNRKLA